MKLRKAWIPVLSLLLVLTLGACGVSQGELDALTAERDGLQVELDELQYKLEATYTDLGKLQSQYDLLNSKYDKLKAEHEELEANTADWLKLSEDEKAAQLAEAEANRIAAEEAEKKAKEEQAAAEKAAAEEAQKKAEAEAAARAEEEKRGYDTGITFDNLARNPDDYEGKKVKFTGEVLQVSELTSEVQIRLATKPNGWGGYSDDVVYLYFSSDLISSRILEDDVITVYGVARGLHSYTTVMGAEVTLPLIEVEKIDV